MLCDFCGSNEASVHLIKIFDNEVEKIYLCAECAKEISMGSEDEILEGLTKLLNKILHGKHKKNGLGLKKSSKARESRRCYNCGIDFGTIKKTGKVGCRECYKEFSDILMPLLKAIHGSVEYKGKVPVNSNLKIKVEKKIKDLKSRMNQEIIIENFEEAARIRDVIKKLQKKLYINKK